MVTLLAFGARDVRAEVDALAGIRIMQLPIGTAHRIADASATAVVEVLPSRTLVVEAALLATDLVRAADGPIRLAKTGTAFARLRITLLTRWAIVDALIVAAGLDALLESRLRFLPANAR